MGTNGALQAQTGGIIPDDSTLANPSQLMVESKGKFLYVANQGNNVLGVNANSGIAGYFITTSPLTRSPSSPVNRSAPGQVPSASSRTPPISSFTQPTS